METGSLRTDSPTDCLRVIPNGVALVLATTGQCHVLLQVGARYPAVPSHRAREPPALDRGSGVSLPLQRTGDARLFDFLSIAINS